MWNVKILTLFPQCYPGLLGYSVVGNALNKQWSLEVKNIRDYATDKHKTVDDTPYGGGGGMVLKVDVLGKAIEDFFCMNHNSIIYLSPRGKLFNQQEAINLSQKQGINILCGRFEGIDERIIMEYNITELSVGDYILSSGDAATIPVVDSCVRLLPGVLDSHNALQEESFGQSAEYRYLLEYPHYTKPRVWNGHAVPDVLLSGNHSAIDKWRFEMAQEKTKIVRPDLWDQFNKGEEK